MRLSETLVFQHIDGHPGAGGDRFVLVDDTNGSEILLKPDDLAHLVIGSTYFIHTVPALKEAMERGMSQLLPAPRDLAWAVFAELAEKVDR